MPVRKDENQIWQDLRFYFSQRLTIPEWSTKTSSTLSATIDCHFGAVKTNKRNSQGKTTLQTIIAF